MLLPLALLGGCSSYERTPASAYLNFWDRMAVRFPWISNRHLCLDRIEDGVVRSLPDDQCYKFKPPERIEGIWVDAFEAQYLLTEAEYRAGEMYYLKRDSWLEVPWRLRPEPRDAGKPRAFRVTFVGRRTLYDGTYRSRNSLNELILMDRFEKIEPLPWVKQKEPR
jgi:hypothetical protein